MVVDAEKCFESIQSGSSGDPAGALCAPGGGPIGGFSFGVLYNFPGRLVVIVSSSRSEQTSVMRMTEDFELCSIG